MSKSLELHQPSAEAALNRSFFRPRFDQPEMEAAWMVERLDTFKRVNKRALWILVLVSLVFAFIDLVYLDSKLAVTLTRIGIVVFISTLLVVVNKVTTVQWGDRILAVACIVGLAVSWFHIFLELPEKSIEAWWLVTLALFGVVFMVLAEMVLWARLAVVGVVLIFGLGAPLKLEMGWSEALMGFSHLLIIFLVGWVAAWQVEVSRRLAFARRLEVEDERGRTVGLLRNILPEPIADKLLSSSETIAERHQAVTVLFADIVGFTPWASACEADEVVEVLDQIFSTFDNLCDEHGVEKIKTIGDAYMAAGGVPSADGPTAANVVRLALDMIAVVKDIPVQKGTMLQLRIGVHEGPVVAGVIGRRKFIYDLWGDTVNTAARMESHGIPGRVQVTEVVAQQLVDGFEVENRGMIEVKGKGPMAAYLVTRSEPRQ